MKKIALILLSALLALSMFACVAKEEDPSNIDDYAAPDYTHQLTEAQGGGIVTFEDGHAESAVIVGYSGQSKPHTVTIPQTITDADRDVTGIGDEAFYQLTTIKEVVLPDTVTFIGKFAFAECTALEKIVIPASVTYIDEYAFYGCTSLKSVVFKGQELTSIGNFAFLNCTALESIALPTGLEEIGNQAFGNCSLITSLETPSTLKKIGNLTFIGCEGLNSEGALKLSASITEIGEFAFSGINKSNISAPEGSYAAKYVAEMTEDETDDAVNDETEADSGNETDTSAQ